MSNKAEQLANLLHYIRGEQEKFFAALPETTRVANGTWDVWAAKDFVAHITFWQKNLAEILNTLDQTPPDQEPFEERNHKNYLNNATRAYAEIQAEYDRSLDEISARVKTFSEAELVTLNHFPRIANGTLQGAVLGNSYSHNVTHLAELLTKHGDAEGGRALQERATQKLIEFDPSPRNKGVALYNLACSFALSGDAPRAIELLRETFPLRPDLRDFSKEDSDFNGVRDLPEFQALYD